MDSIREVCDTSENEICGITRREDKIIGRII